MKIDEIKKLSVLTLYRLIIKNCKYYPSKNRFQIMLAAKEDFRENRTLTNERLIFIETKKARIGLSHLLLYKEKNQEL